MHPCGRRVASVAEEPWQWEPDLAHAPGRPRRDPAHWAQPDPAEVLDEPPPRDIWISWFRRGHSATWELYRRHGWDALVVGPLPGHTVSGVEQTELVALVLSRRHPAAVDGVCAGITEALLEIMGGIAAQLRVRGRPGLSPQGGPPPISGGLAFPPDSPPA